MSLILFVFKSLGIFKFLDEAGNKIFISSNPKFKQYSNHSSIFLAL